MLPYDQIAPERRTWAGVTGRLEDRSGVIGGALAEWMARDDSKAEPDARRAANTAMDAIDAMLADLHQIRSRLIGEIRQADDLAMERSAELLERCRAARLAG